MEALSSSANPGRQIGQTAKESTRTGSGRSCAALAGATASPAATKMPISADAPAKNCRIFIPFRSTGPSGGRDSPIAVADKHCLFAQMHQCGRGHERAMARNVADRATPRGSGRSIASGRRGASPLRARAAPVIFCYAAESLQGKIQLQGGNRNAPFSRLSWHVQKFWEERP